jgi:hypothetical protein
MRKILTDAAVIGAAAERTHTISLRHCLCSTTFGVDFSVIPLGGNEPGS